MKNGWYLVYTKTEQEWDDTAGCCGGAGSGGSFVDTETDIYIPLQAATEKKAENEAKKKWEELIAEIIKKDAPGYWNETKEKTLHRAASNPRIVYKYKSKLEIGEKKA